MKKAIELRLLCTCPFDSCTTKVDFYEVGDSELWIAITANEQYLNALIDRSQAATLRDILNELLGE